MVRAVPVAAANPDDRLAFAALLDEAEAAGATPPLSDHLLVELRHPNAASATVVVLADEIDDRDDRDGGALSGIAVVQPGNGSWSLETVSIAGGSTATGSSADHDRSSDVERDLFDGALRAVAARGGGAVTWWRLGSTPASAIAAADEHGFTMHRELHQMRRTLPVPDRTAVAVRAFRPGRDDAAWLRVNNRAFADHAEQGGWDRAALSKRMAEPWFDPAGFLLHERDGVLAAFCWTKVHSATEPPMGEIYAIAVDPAFHGLGLGRALTVAGLQHLGNVAVNGGALDVAMLHVDAANTAAVGLYETLGFEIDHTDQAYVAHVASRVRPRQ